MANILTAEKCLQSLNEDAVTPTQLVKRLHLPFKSVVCACEFLHKHGLVEIISNGRTRLIRKLKLK